jgi:hypothetical protein
MKHLTYIITIIFILLGCGNRNNKSTINVHKEIYAKDIDKTDLKSDINNLLLSEFIIINEDFEYILETSIEEYNKCDRIEKDYHFSISIQNAKIKESSGVKSMYIAIDSVDSKEFAGAKSLYISRSYHKDFVARGYGFFYYKNYLFILEGQQLDDIFKKTNKTETFLYKFEPIVTFDPPRWLYCYWNKFFYWVYSSPCGG